MTESGCGPISVWSTWALSLASSASPSERFEASVICSSPGSLIFETLVKSEHNSMVSDEEETGKSSKHTFSVLIFLQLGILETLLAQFQLENSGTRVLFWTGRLFEIMEWMCVCILFSKSLCPSRLKRSPEPCNSEALHAQLSFHYLRAALTASDQLETLISLLSTEWVNFTKENKTRKAGKKEEERNYVR